MKKEDNAIILSHAGIRGVAATIVMFVHFVYYGITNNHISLGHEKHLICVGWIAVDLFFMLSGFILCWVYNLQDKAIFWKRYLVARIARICPLYYITLFLAIILIAYSYIRHGLQYIGQHNFLESFAANIFLISGVVDLPTFNGPAWSISVEFTCYLAVFPLLVLTARRWFSGGDSRYRKIAIIILIEAICVIGLQLCILHQNYKFNSWSPIWILRGLFGFTGGFFLGILFRMIKPKLLYIIYLKIISCVSAAFVVLAVIGVIPATIAIYALPFLVLTLAYDIGPIAALLSTKALQKLGDLSYGIYMWHMLILLAFIKQLQFHLGSFFNPGCGAFGIVSFLLYAALVIVVAALSYRWFEVPSRKWIRSLLS